MTKHLEMSHPNRWGGAAASPRRPRPSPRPCSPAEERANAFTHGIGALLGIAALALLVAAAAPLGATALIAVAVFGAALVLVYGSSTLHHGLTRPALKRVFLLADRGGIYLLIAGTYTPVALLALAPPLGPALAATVWGLAAFGVALEIAGHWRAARRRPGPGDEGADDVGQSGLGRLAWLPMVLYLGMGWLGLVVAGPDLAWALAPAALFWLVAGGIVYTTGVVFYLWRALPYGHAVWHLFAVGGSACHVWAVLGHVLPAVAG